MTTVIITEKPNQAKNVIKALGSTGATVVTAQGHLVQLVDPEEEVPAFKSWTTDVLVPPKGRYPTKASEDSGKPGRLSAIRAALRTATECIIATDCDREGQLIGQEIIDFLGFKGPVKRAMFSAEDPKSLQDAFANAKDNSVYSSLYEAAMTRQQIDQIFNLTMTRAVTVSFRPHGARDVYGIGRVKTPTLGFLVRRELDIRNFKPEDYYEVEMTVKGAAGEALLRHAPADDHRIRDKPRAEAILAAAKGWRGPLKVERARKKTAPPRPMDLPTLQKKTGAWGWTTTRTDETAQSLYDTHTAITYPRAESRYLPENAIPSADAIFRGLKGIPEYAAYPLASPVIRTGKQGVFCDAELSGKNISHHAIIPNVNVPGRFADVVSRMNADEKRLFDLIARSFLAAVGDDYVYDQTILSAQVATSGPPSPVRFSASGSLPVSLGWREALGSTMDDDDQDAAKTFPPFGDGDPVASTLAALKAKKTVPPKRLTEGDLVDMMINAHREVRDPAERDRLKEAKGIGTPATRSSMIKELRRKKMIDSFGKFVVPTEAAIELHLMVDETMPELTDPGATARMEMRLDEIQAGKATMDEVIAEVVARARGLIPKIESAGRAKKITAAAAIDRSQIKGARAPKAGAKPGAKPPAGRPGAPATPSRAPTASASQQGGALPDGATILLVSYAQKDDAKALGARWHQPMMKWYAPKGADLTAFKAKGYLK